MISRLALSSQFVIDTTYIFDLYEVDHKGCDSPSYDFDLSWTVLVDLSCDGNYYNPNLVDLSASSSSLSCSG